MKSLQTKKAFDKRLLVDYFEMKVLELGERKFKINLFQRSNNGNNRERFYDE